MRTGGDWRSEGSRAPADSSAHEPVELTRTAPAGPDGAFGHGTKDSEQIAVEPARSAWPPPASALIAVISHSIPLACPARCSRVLGGRSRPLRTPARSGVVTRCRARRRRGCSLCRSQHLEEDAIELFGCRRAASRSDAPRPTQRATSSWHGARGVDARDHLCRSRDPQRDRLETTSEWRRRRGLRGDQRLESRQPRSDVPAVCGRLAGAGLGDHGDRRARQRPRSSPRSSRSPRPPVLVDRRPDRQAALRGERRQRQRLVLRCRARRPHPR